MDDRSAHIAFSAFPGIGPQRFKLLTEYFGSATAALEASENNLRQLGLGEKLLQKFLAYRADFEPQKFESQILQKEIKIITRLDRAYPSRLKEIPDPPIAIYVKGVLPNESSPHVAVVGTRKPTSYGSQITENLTQDLVVTGCVIVSGLARGVDGIAHRTALTRGGKTIAVLGCGVDIVYPPEHKALYGEILAKNSAIISEVPPGHTVIKGLFPARNRIISGLSLGTVVTEGAQDSGSLITARYAAEQGRDVFAVPGPITSYLSAGPARLIKDGAKMVTEAADILTELGINFTKLPQNKIGNTLKSVETAYGRQSFTAEENNILSLLSKNGQLHYDEIVREAGLTSSQVGINLTKLELTGIIRALGNGKYALR